MKVVVGAVGRPGTGAMGEAIRDYQERVRRYFRFETVEVEHGSGSEPEAVMRREGKALLDRLPGELQRFALARDGKGMTSEGLARHLDRVGTYGRPGVAFLIGGTHGLSQEVRERCQYRLSLSPMTLPHQLARLLLTEQLYRAGTILRGEPYHRG